MNNELRRLWKEMAVACFKIVSQYLSGAEENHEKPIKIAASRNVLNSKECCTHNHDVWC
jgi:hypothetical protein